MVPRVPLLLVSSILVGFAAGAHAQTPGLVRVVDPSAPIIRWLSPAPREVLAVVDSGTSLEVLDSENGWYWVVTPRDAHGTRRVGWIAARHVESVPDGTHGADAAPPAAEWLIPVSSAESGEAVVLDEEEIRPERPSGDEERPVSRRFDFEAVPFDLDRFSLRPDAARILDAAAAALIGDTTVQVTIEGHTCSLGTPQYNLALGQHRAAAVREYLVRRGVAPDRLRVVSYGEERPAYDNAREETRQLNRRVVLVAIDQP